MIMTKNQYQSVVMKHLNSDAYEHLQDKNIDKKVMQKIEEFTKQLFRHTRGMGNRVSH